MPGSEIQRVELTQGNLIHFVLIFTTEIEMTLICLFGVAEKIRKPSAYRTANERRSHTTPEHQNTRGPKHQSHAKQQNTILVFMRDVVLFLNEYTFQARVKWEVSNVVDVTMQKMMHQY